MEGQTGGRLGTQFRHVTFLRPPLADVPEAEIPISRLSIHARQLEAVQEYSETVPLVLVSAWRAADGDIGVAVASVADHSVPVRMTLNGADYPMPDAGTAVSVDRKWADERLSV